MQIDQEYEVVRIDGDSDILKEHPQNPNRSHDAAIDESVEENGWYGAVIAQKSTGYILAGHGRYRTAMGRKAREIPVIWKDVDDETALRILLGDNQIARLAIIDEEQLNQVLASLESLAGTGFDTVLHPLEAAIEAESGEKSKGGSEDSALNSDEPSTGDGESPADDAPPGPDDIPDDVYTPEFGVMVVCDSEQAQKAVYEWLAKEGILTHDGVKVVRVVAV